MSAALVEHGKPAIGNPRTLGEAIRSSRIALASSVLIPLEASRKIGTSKRNTHEEAARADAAAVCFVKADSCSVDTLSADLT